MSTIQILYKDMAKYKTTAIDFHAGDLLEHSTWITLFVDNIYMDKGCTTCEWSDDIPKTDEIRKIINVTAFLHDIGKAGDGNYVYYDKPDHPQIGAQYILGQKSYKYVDDNGIEKSLDINSLLREFQMTGSRYPEILACFINNHWLFGSYMKKMTSNNLTIVATDYINEILNNCSKFGLDFIRNDKTERLLFFKIQMLISACDVRATQPYMDHDMVRKLTKTLKDNVKDTFGSREYHVNASKIKQNINYKSPILPYISNMPQVHPGIDGYKVFGYGEKGLLLRKEVIRLLS